MTTNGTEPVRFSRKSTAGAVLRRVLRRQDAIEDTLRQIRETGNLYVLEEWLDRKQLAAYLGVSMSSVDNLTRDGMPHSKILGKRRFRASLCEAWLRERGNWEDVA